MCISSPTAGVMEASESRNETTEEERWQRIVQTRVRECVSFGDVLFLPIFGDFGETVADSTLFAQTLENLLHQHIRIFTGGDVNGTVASRRQSWRLVKGVFTKIEDTKRGGVDAIRRSQDLPTGEQVAYGSEVSNEATQPLDTTATSTLGSLIEGRSATRGPENQSLSRVEVTRIDHPAQVVGSSARTISTMSQLRSTPTEHTEASANVAIQQKNAPLAPSRSFVGTRRDLNQLANESVDDADGRTLLFTAMETSKQRKRKDPPDQESSNSPAQAATSLSLHIPASDEPPGCPTVGTTEAVQTRAIRINTAPSNSSSNEVHEHQQNFKDKRNQSIQANRNHLDLKAESSMISQSPAANGEPKSLSTRDTGKKYHPEKVSLLKASVDSNSDELYGDFDSNSNQPQKASSDDQRGRLPPGLSSKYTRMNDRTSSTEALDAWHYPDTGRLYEKDSPPKVSVDSNSDKLYADLDSNSKAPQKASSDDLRGRWVPPGLSSNDTGMNNRVKSTDACHYYPDTGRSYDDNQADIASDMSMSDDSASSKTHRKRRRESREQYAVPSAHCQDQFVTCSNLDVLITWANRANNWAGNVDFVRRMNRYCSSNSSEQYHWMDDLIWKAMQDVERKGGRFLREYSSLSSEPLCDDQWLLLERSEALKCLRKLLNDTSEFAWSPSEERQQRRMSESRYDTGYRNSSTDGKAPFSSRRRQAEDQRRSSLGSNSERDLISFSEQYIEEHSKIRGKWWCRVCYKGFHYDKYEDHVLGGGHQKRLDARMNKTRGPHDAVSTSDMRHQSIDHQVRAPASIKVIAARPTNGASKRVNFPVLEDIGANTLARTLKKRPRTNVTVDIRLHDDLPDVQRRLSEWDPFWVNLQVVHVGVTSKVQSTVPHSDVINTATQYDLPYPLIEKVDVPGLDWSQKRTPTVWSDGDVALILRMLPLSQGVYKGKRSDCHLWPKGTFVQINGKPVEVEQRIQQAHNEGKEWKGMSKELDVTPLLELDERNRIQLCCFDGPFIYALVCCRFRTVSTLFQMLTDQTSPERLTFLSREASIEKAIQFADRQMAISLDDDHEVEQQPCDELGKFVFSLSCPYLKNIILSYPVRGKDCKHFQCFDLKSYLSCNAHVTGSRWRCASCEKFVSLQSLEICGFTSDLLREFHNVLSPTRDRVQVNADGTYMLLEERKERSRNRTMHDVVDTAVVAIE